MVASTNSIQLNCPPQSIRKRLRNYFAVHRNSSRKDCLKTKIRKLLPTLKSYALVLTSQTAQLNRFEIEPMRIIFRLNDWLTREAQWINIDEGRPRQRNGNERFSLKTCQSQTQLALHQWHFTDIVTVLIWIVLKCIASNSCTVASVSKRRPLCISLQYNLYHSDKSDGDDDDDQARVIKAKVCRGFDSRHHQYLNTWHFPLLYLAWGRWGWWGWGWWGWCGWWGWGGWGGWGGW